MMKLPKSLFCVLVLGFTTLQMSPAPAQTATSTDSPAPSATQALLAQATDGASRKPLEGHLEDGTANGGIGTNDISLTKQSGKNGAKKPLQGQIHAVGAVLPAIKLHMSEAQRDAAVRQYAGDLKQFYLHLRDYNAAAEAHKKLAGECTENEQQWQLKLKNDKLSLSQVIIPVGVTNIPPPPPSPPDIPPPRICCVGCLITGRCGHLGTGGGGGNSTPGSARIDSMRTQQAMADLGKAQNELKYAETENGYTKSKAIDEAKIEQSQQNLAAKFGQLKDEYDMLKIEKTALTGIQTK